MNQLTEELQCVRAEKAVVLSEQNADTQENLLTAVTAERDQLNLALQQNAQMVSCFAFSDTFDFIFE